MPAVAAAAMAPLLVAVRPPVVMSPILLATGSMRGAGEEADILKRAGCIRLATRRVGTALLLPAAMIGGVATPASVGGMGVALVALTAPIVSVLAALAACLRPLFLSAVPVTAARFLLATLLALAAA
uniref:hypothetical protein n=1 Tax=uncultured Hyphomicrobium sp. TaxID=194373 RepID=UPI0025E34450